MNEVAACSTRAMTLLAAIVLAAMATTAHWPAVHDGTIWDDNLYVTENQTLRDADGLSRIWFRIDGSENYFPLLFTAWWLEYRLTGLDVTVGHAINVLLHVLSALILWRFLIRLRTGGAWVAAALFAVHPVTVESVAWLSERKNALSMPLFLLSMLMLLRFDEANAAPATTQEGSDPSAPGELPVADPADSKSFPLRFRKSTYVASLVLFFLALLVKTSVVTLPLLMLIHAWWRHGRITRRDVLRTAPFFAVALLLGLATAYHELMIGIGEYTARAEGFGSRLAASGWCIWFYLYKLALPWGLSMVYPRWDVDPGSAAAWLPLLVLLVLVFAAWRRRTAWGRPLLAALGAYIALLLPVLGILDIGFFVHSFVSDHFQYAAMWLPLALAAAVAVRLFRTSKSPAVTRVGVGITALLLAGLSTLTWVRASIYASPEALWRDALETSPNSWVVRSQLGTTLIGLQQYEEAIEQFRKSLKLRDDNYEGHHNLGIALAALDRHDEAIESFRTAIERDPSHHEAHFHLAQALFITGQGDTAAANYRESVTHYLETLKRKPDHAEAHHHLGACLVALGRIGEAVVCYRRSLLLRPDSVDTHSNLAAVLVARHDFDGAIRHIKLALRGVPRSVVLRVRLADAHAAKGQFDKAVEVAKKALVLAVQGADGAVAQQIRARIVQYERQMEVGTR